MIWNQAILSEGKTIKRTRVLSKAGPLLAFVLICIALEIVTGGRFLTTSNIANILRQVPIIALMAIGMLCVILLGGIDLSAGSLLAIGLCTSGVVRKFYLTNDSLLSGIILLTICIVVSTVFGFINGILLTKLRLPHPFIATLGSKFVCRGLALLITGSATISGFPNSATTIGTYNLFGAIPLSFILTISLYIVMHIFLSNVATGRKIYAFGGNREAAKYAGINTDRVQILCYSLSGLFCGIAGIVYLGRLNSAVPLATQDGDMDAIASCIIGGASFLGGKGNVWGTLVGAFMIQVIRNGCTLLKLSTDLQQIVIGIIIIVAVYIDVLRNEMDNKRKLLAVAKANKVEDANIN